jgi:hypothetical protein
MATKKKILSKAQFGKSVNRPKNDSITKAYDKELLMKKQFKKDKTALNAKLNELWGKGIVKQKSGGTVKSKKK